MRKAPNEGGDSERDAAGGRKGREGCSPLGARLFHMYKGAKRLNDEYRNGKPGEQNAPMARASGCHPSLHVVLDFWSRFFFSAVRSFFARLSAGLFEKYRRLLCQLLIKTTTGCAARTTG